MSAKTEQINEEKFQRALAFHRNGHFAQAGSLYEEVLQSQPKHANAAFFLGLSYAQRNNLDLAAKFFGRAAKTNPAFVDAHFNCGLAHHSAGRPWEALESYDRTIRLKADHSVALHNRGVILSALKRHDEALQSLDRAIDADRNYAEAYSNRGAVLAELKRFESAIENYDLAIKINPKHAEAHSNRAAALGKLQRFEEALQNSDHAIRLIPNHAEAHLNRSIVLNALKRHEEALQSCARAIEIRPNYVDAYANAGAALLASNRFEKAAAAYEKALALNPGHAEAWCGLGNVFSALKRTTEALDAYAKATGINSELAAAWHGLGNILSQLKRCDEAARAYARVLEIDPAYEFMKGLYLHQKMLCCDWSGIENLFNEIESDIAAAKPSADPFGWQGIAASDRSLQTCAELYANKKFPADARITARARFDNGKKIRIGYSSGEFREQATSFLIAGLLEQHDKNKFEIYAVDNGWDDHSEIRTRINASVQSVINVANLSDAEAAAAIAQNQIDILVNLNGYFGQARMGIFARRAAPIQVNYLGFPGTLGATYMDYTIADAQVIPDTSRAYFDEKIAYLPHSYQANDNKKEISAHSFTRAECALPDAGFVFCCFNNNYKIVPDIFDIWMRILRHMEGSVLWLIKDNEMAAANLRKEATARGVDAERLIFAERVLLPEHLARHRCADLFLDTLPYNAHTTASDALWAGLPLLTCVGDTFAGRVAASLLTALDMPELITRTKAEYELLAIELATRPDKLASLKQKLDDHRLVKPLFDTALFTRHIEAAYTTMHERYRADLPPDHIYVQR